MNTQIKCLSCGYGKRTYEGTNKVRRISIELKESDIIGKNGSSQILKRCPKCNEKKLVKAV